MATVVFLHAHPDDESMLTAGTMAALATGGHRVVLVTATRGEQGEVAPGVLAPGEDLATRRSAELEAAADALGVGRLVVLGYADSGMMGTDANQAPDCFWQADTEAAARAVAGVLAEEQADVLVLYDDHGGYGHPDHIQVHRVGVRAAELAGTPTTYEATIDRDRVVAMVAMAGAEPGGADLPNFVDAEFGVPAAHITTRVDVRDHLDTKRRAMRCHATQISESSWILRLPPDRFALAFGEEQYVRRGAPPGLVETTLAVPAGR